MTKKTFLKLLRKRLGCLSRREKNERISFYSEMIDDRMEDGHTEAEAIYQIGSVDEIAKQVIDDSKTEKRMERDSANTTKIILLICGFPVWFPLLVALYAVLFSLFVSFVSLVLSLWATFIAVAVSSPLALLIGTYHLFVNSAPYGIMMIAAGVVCAGLAIFLYFGALSLTRLIPLIAKILFEWTKIFYKGRVKI